MKRMIAIVLIITAMVCLLVGCGDSSLKAYKFRVVDEKGNGVAGVTLQICTDENCRMFKTDSNGNVDTKDLPAAAYEIHILMAPEGYTFDSEEIYKTSATFEAHDFVVKAG